jgi:hypothetical protein
MRGSYRKCRDCFTLVGLEGHAFHEGPSCAAQSQHAAITSPLAATVQHPRSCTSKYQLLHPSHLTDPCRYGSAPSSGVSSSEGQDSATTVKLRFWKCLICRSSGLLLSCLLLIHFFCSTSILIAGRSVGLTLACRRPAGSVEHERLGKSPLCPSVSIPDCDALAFRGVHDLCVLLPRI